jgi:hypothetical protein
MMVATRTTFQTQKLSKAHKKLTSSNILVSHSEHHVQFWEAVLQAVILIILHELLYTNVCRVTQTVTWEAKLHTQQSSRRFDSR